jgi:hypothetical protein
MIINYDKKFLFIHIQKTAGTSIRENLMKNRGTELFHYPHTLLKHVRLNDEQERFFKFAFVRNPWDRLYSWYIMIKAIGPTTIFYRYILENSNDFSGFLRLTDIIKDDYIKLFNTKITNYKCIAFNQLDYITDHTGSLNIDFIGRFENLEEDYKSVCDILKLNNIPLEHLNQTKRGNYRSIYKDTDIELVYQMYKRDIDYFGYKF